MAEAVGQLNMYLNYYAAVTNLYHYSEVIDYTA